MRKVLTVAIPTMLVWAASCLAMEVLIDSPSSRAPIFGMVEFRVEVVSNRPIAQVELRVDGHVEARISTPPYKVLVDVGTDNRSHLFEAVALDIDGEEVTATLETREIHVDLELDLELQQLYVTVTRDGSRILDLEREDFEILDDRKKQTMVTFEGGDVPLTGVLLVDTSLSMKGRRLASALEGAGTFVREMDELDEAMALLFSDQIERATAFTSDPATLSTELEGVEARGGTALNDHLYLALQLLEARQGRRVIILLSDGVDVESALQMKDVAWKAGRGQVLVYWIRPRDSSATEVISWSSSWRNGKRHREEYDGLLRVVSESGGRILEIDSIEDAPDAFLEILAELREQYVLGYYPSENRHDGSWHEVRVKVGGFGLHVRARAGYLDY